MAPAPLTVRERQIVDSWLTCIECVGSELDSVRAVSLRKPTATVDTLTKDLLAGLVGLRLSNVQSQFNAYYTMLVDYTASMGDSLHISRTDYVAHYSASVSGIYRSRAAIALGRIGGIPARNALDAALDSAASASSNFPPTVVAAVRFARDTLWIP